MKTWTPCRWLEKSPGVHRQRSPTIRRDVAVSMSGMWVAFFFFFGGGGVYFFVFLMFVSFDMLVGGVCVLLFLL